MIIKHYFYRSLVEKLVWVTVLLVLILASSRFVGFLADAAEGNLPGDLVFLMLAFKILASLPKILPISILIATLLTYSKMTHDRELVILAASGVSRFFQINIVVQFAALFCIFVAIITLFLAPWAQQNMHTLKQKAKQESDISGIKPGQFKEFSEGNRIVYIQEPSADKKSMTGVFLQVRQQDKLSVLTSDRAHFEINNQSSNKYIVFSNGRRYVSKQRSLDYQIMEYDKYAVLVEQNRTNTSLGKTAGLSTLEIINSSKKAYQAEFQWRLSLIFACLLLPILAILLYQSPVQDRRYTPFIIAITLYLIYSNLLSISQTLLKRGIISPFIGLWWVHLLLIGILLFLYSLPRLRLYRGRSNAH